MLLAGSALSVYLCGVFEHRGPVIPLPKGFSCQSPSSDMVATDAFMHTSQYVVGILLNYAFKEGCGKAPFIKGPPQKREYG